MERSGCEGSGATSRERRRYERALRAASAQLRRSRERERHASCWIASLDIVQGLRRAARQTTGRSALAAPWRS